ncbi:MAG: DUF350 domain-containing protein [Prochlorococcus sp.]
MPQVLEQLLLTVFWTIVGVLLILGGTWLFDRLTPIDYRAEIRKGNTAAGVVVAAIIVAVGAVVVAVLVT